MQGQGAVGDKKNPWSCAKDIQRKAFAPLLPVENVGNNGDDSGRGNKTKCQVSQ